MKVFVAGGSGTIGVPLVRALRRAGHDVTALTRSARKQDALCRLGASVAVADALNRVALVRAVTAAHPTHVIHQLTALPAGGPKRARDLAATNRLRIEGTRNLIDASVAAGARRLVVGSFAMLSHQQSGGGSSDDPAVAAVRSMEQQVLDATAARRIEGVVLRYGLFYGRETPSTAMLMDMVRKRRLPRIRGDRSQLPWIHIDDAVAATVLALDRGPAGAVYDIVDEHPASLSEIVDMLVHVAGAPRPRTVPGWLLRLFAPYMSRITSVRMPLSNRLAKEQLGWHPAFPTLRTGLTR